MKALVGAFNQEKALVGAFSVIVKTNCETDGSFYCTINKSNPVYCESQNFVSLVRSKCKTRLGNQLSSYAAIRYFQEQFGMNPILDPFQMNMIKSGKI